MRPSDHAHALGLGAEDGMAEEVTNVKGCFSGFTSSQTRQYLGWHSLGLKKSSSCVNSVTRRRLWSRGTMSASWTPKWEIWRPSCRCGTFHSRRSIAWSAGKFSSSRFKLRLATELFPKQHFVTKGGRQCKRQMKVSWRRKAAKRRCLLAARLPVPRREPRVRRPGRHHRRAARNPPEPEPGGGPGWPLATCFGRLIRLLHPAACPSRNCPRCGAALPARRACRRACATGCT